MKGVRVEVAFGEYIVPPISLRLHYDHKADRKVIGDLQTPPDEWTDVAVRFVLAILRQNYPDLTEAKFFEAASTNDLGPIIVAAQSQSGYVKRPLDQRSPPSPPAENSSDSSSTPPAGSPMTSSTGSPGPT